MRTQFAYSWEKDEFSRPEKTLDWFWYVGLAALVGAALALYFGNTLLAALAILAGIALALEGARRPATLRYGISERGIHVGKKLYPYGELVGFSLDESPSPLLFLHLRAPLVQTLTLPLPETGVEALHVYLSKKIPEKERVPAVGDILAERIGL